MMYWKQSRHLPGGIEGSYEISARIAGRDSNRATPEYKSRALLLGLPPFYYFDIVPFGSSKALPSLMATIASTLPFVG
jgi:hypothetical protein